MKFNACETCARIYSENNYVCFTCRDGHHHKVKGEEMDKNLYRYCHMCKHSNHGKRDITTYMCYSCGQRDVNNFESEIDINSFYPQHDDIPDTVRLMKLAAHSIYGYPRPPKGVPTIKKVIFNDPATIILWTDGTKTVVKCQEGDIYDPEKGMAMAICKRALGNQGNYCEVFKKWLPEEEPVVKFDGSELVRAIRNMGKANNMLGEILNRRCKQAIEDAGKEFVKGLKDANIPVAKELEELVKERAISGDYDKVNNGPTGINK